jgi:hypothetical protein
MILGLNNSIVTCLGIKITECYNRTRSKEYLEFY